LHISVQLIGQSVRCKTCPIAKRKTLEPTGMTGRRLLLKLRSSDQRSDDH